jgi:hypothetical protein
MSWNTTTPARCSAAASSAAAVPLAWWWQLRKVLIVARCALGRATTMLRAGARRPGGFGLPATDLTPAARGRPLVASSSDLDLPIG